MIPMNEKLQKNKFFADQLCSDQLYSEIICHNVFQRLFDIPFMGGLAYLDKDNKKTTSRGDHSIDVASLALYYAKQNNLTKKAERLLVVSSLLHDLTHLPFSHTMDFAMKHQKGFSHDREALELIACKEGATTSIADLLSKFKIDTPSLFLFKPKSKRPIILKSTHNIDTLDGISRAHVYFQNDGKQGQLSAMEIIDAIAHDSNDRNSHDYGKYLSLWDRFWDLKSEVYSKNIYECKKLIFERILGYYLYDLCERNKITDRLLKYSDDDLIGMFPELIKRIECLWEFINEEFNSNEHKATDKSTIKLLFVTRRFALDDRVQVKFNKTSSLKRRYKVLPSHSVITLKNSFIPDLSDMLSYPLLNKRFGEIAFKADNYLL